MPRQPILSVVRDTYGMSIKVGVRAIGQRPEIEALIAHCLMTWPHVEAEMALLLGQLTGAPNVSHAWPPQAQSPRFR
jgi:hypothetical protein